MTKQREHAATGDYHCVFAAHNHDMMFADSEVKARLLESLRLATEKYDVALLGDVVMTNHVHCVLEGDLDKISLVFQSIGGRFCRWYRRRTGTSGSVFDQRYFSKPIEDGEQFFNTLAYICNNPVAAGLAKSPDEYGWSSFTEMVQDHAENINLELLKERCNVKDLCEFTREKASSLSASVFELLPKRRTCDLFIADEIKKMNEELGKDDINEWTDEEFFDFAVEMLDAGSNMYQLASVAGISYHKVRKLLL